MMQRAFFFRAAKSPVDVHAPVGLSMLHRSLGMLYALYLTECRDLSQHLQAAWEDATERRKTAEQVCLNHRWAAAFDNECLRLLRLTQPLTAKPQRSRFHLWIPNVLT